MQIETSVIVLFGVILTGEYVYFINIGDSMSSSRSKGSESALCKHFQLRPT